MPILPAVKTAGRDAELWMVKEPNGPSILSRLPSGTAVRTIYSACVRILLACCVPPRAALIGQPAQITRIWETVEVFPWRVPPQKDLMYRPVARQLVLAKLSAYPSAQKHY
jgi:hypothetical protein